MSFSKEEAYQIVKDREIDRLEHLQREKAEQEKYQRMLIDQRMNQVHKPYRGPAIGFQAPPKPACNEGVSGE